jgi:hypothetical protein
VPSIVLKALKMYLIQFFHINFLKFDGAAFAY